MGAAMDDDWSWVWLVIIGGLIVWFIATSGNDSSSEVDAGDTYYSNCSEAREAGVENITPEEPGYRSALDADGDGFACEPYNPW